NVRELSNVIERVALLEEAPLITREILGLREPTAMETPQSADGEEAVPFKEELEGIDRKSTRLNSSHEWISYAVFCLKKKKQPKKQVELTDQTALVACPERTETSN